MAPDKSISRFLCQGLAAVIRDGALLLRPPFSTLQRTRKAEATPDKSISRLPGPRLLISDPRILLPPPKTLQAPPPPPSARPNQTNPEIFSHLLWYNYSSSFGPILVLPLAQLIASVFSGQPYSCLTLLSFPSRNVVVRFHHF